MKRKLLLVALAISLLIAGIAGASRVRVVTLGNVNHIVKDKANILLYPQLISNYPTWASMEIDGTTPASLYSVGGHYQYKNAVYGMYIDNTGIPEGTISFIPYGPIVGENGAGDASTAPKLDLYYGRKLGDIPFGMNLSIYQNGWTDKTVGSSAERSQTYIGIGLGATLIEKLDLSIAFRTHSFTDKNAAGTDVTKPNGGLMLDINARYWHDLNEKTSVVPHFEFGMENQGADSVTIGKYSNSGTMIQLGCGLNHRLSENTLIVGDIGISLGSGTYKVEPVGAASSSIKWSDNEFPYYQFGFETAINNWLVARAGAQRGWTTASMDKVEQTASSTTNLYLGAGFKKGDFTLDLNVDPGFINRGPYFITGSGGNWSTMASLNYTPSK